MLLDLIFIAFIALFTWVGYRRGFVLSLIKTLGWVVAIWLAAKWTTGLSVYVRVLLFTGNEYTERAIAFGVALIFVKLAYYAITLLFSKKHHEDDMIGLADSIAGAVIGFASGAIFVLVLVLLIPAVADIFKLDNLANMFSSSRVALYIFNHNPLTGVIGHISELDALKEVDLDKYKELGESALKKMMPLIKKVIGKFIN